VSRQLGTISNLDQYIIMEKKFTIESDTDEYIHLRDLKPGGETKFGQQDAQGVMQWLHDAGYVTTEDKQVIYQDSDDEVIELYHDGNGNFEGFGFTQLD
jgi:hypothetical protein